MTKTYLFVINSFLAGGAERSLLNFLPDLERAGVTPVVSALRRAEVGFEEEVRAHGYRVELIGGTSRLSQILALRRLIKELRPALVYTALFDADLAGRLAAVGTKVPVVSSLVNTAYEPARSLDSRVKPSKLAAVKFLDMITGRLLTTHFHAVSHAAKASAVTHLRIRPERITVVERGRNDQGERSAERKSAVRSRESITAEQTVFLTVGRQEFQKGQAHLLRAVAGVKEEVSGALLLVAGREGNASRELTELNRDLALGDVVRFLGHREDIPDLLAAADVFVFPSLFEGLGGAVIEAMAAGLPVIASDIPALRETTGGEEAAILVPPGRPDLLTEAMVRMARDQSMRDRLGTGARRAYLERFQTEQAHRRLLELLQRVATAGR